MATQSPSQPSNGESLSVRVAREVAAHDGVDPLELSPPLFHSLDPAALDALFESTGGGDSRTGRVIFAHDGKEITVGSDGEVTIESDRPEPQSSR